MALAGTTMLVWATLPIALSAMLRSLDAPTVTWFRFALSALVVGAALQSRRALPRVSTLERRDWILLAAATLGLAANYVLYVVGLSLVTPANAQILMQVSPLLLALGGIAIFQERFDRVQWTGFGVLVAGLALFFSDQLRAFDRDDDRYLVGSGVLLAASVVWAIYGLAQKQLLVRLSSQGLLLCIYAGCTLCLLPWASPGQLTALGPRELALLLYCALGTVVGYGAFSASLAHLEASRVGAIIALTPVGTFGFVVLTHRLLPGVIPAEHFSAPMLAGAATVVAGSLLTSRAPR